MNSLNSNDTYVIASTWLVLLLPLLSFFVSMLFSRKVSWLVTLSAPLILAASTILSFMLLYSAWNSNDVLRLSWFSISGLTFAADMALSNEALLMLAVVSLVSFLVHVYSIGYMAGDSSPKKYFAMLGFFTFSMQGIVLADNLLMLFVFWELVGFSSYMLIGHWNENPLAARAAKKAFLYNRLGDAGFIIGLMIIWANAGTFSISDLSQFSEGWQTSASLLILCGVIGKSAQFPLFGWLPDAMEGPTPVSALIHAATMVAAGVYLLLRVFDLFTETSLQVAAIVGTITAIAGSMSALFQHDIKKILAFSTISQLGFMLIAVGAGAPHAAFLHLVTHAFFKACLFLCAGSITYSLQYTMPRLPAFDAQDIGNLGGLRKKLPVTFWCFMISGAGLAGLPFFAGFISKEAILSAAWLRDDNISIFLRVAIPLIMLLTALYVIRLIYFIFFKAESRTVSVTLYESPFVMKGPMIILSVLCFWFVVGINPFGTNSWAVAGLPAGNIYLVFLSLIILAIAFLIGYFFIKKGFPTNASVANVFYFDTLSAKLLRPFVRTSTNLVNFVDRKVIDKGLHGVAYSQVTLAHIFSWFDRAVVDGIVNGMGRTARAVGSVTRSFQGGNIQVYIFWSVFAIIIFLIWAMK